MDKDKQYRESLEALQAEYDQLGQKKADIEARMEYIRESIIGLSHLLGKEVTDLSIIPEIAHAGLTDACRAVLRSALHPMNPREIRDRLEELGYDLGKYVNAMASIHTTLKRLAESGEIELANTPSGAPAYQVKAAPRTAMKR